MDQNTITESDILAGQKILSLETRTGSLITVVAHALPWRKVIQFASESDLPKRNLQTIEAGVDPSHLADDSLDSLTPDSIGLILSAISLLTNGLPTLKKNQALMAKLKEETETVGRASPRAETETVGRASPRAEIYPTVGRASPRAVPLPSPTSTPPNANSSNPVIPLTTSDDIPRSKYYKRSEANADANPSATSDSSNSPSAPALP